MLWRQLECFLATGRNCSFSLAAKELFLSQPVVSHHITNLEKELGIQLFYRSPHAVQFTAPGRELYEKLSPLVDEINQCITCYNTNIPHRDLKISSTYLLNYQIFHPTIKLLKSRHPNVDLLPQSLPYDSALKHLLSGELDGLFCFENEASAYSDLKFYPLFPIRTNGYLVPLSDPLSEKSSVTYQDLIGKTLILPRNISQQQRFSSCYAKILKLKDQIQILYADDMLSLYSMISQSMGIAISIDFIPSSLDTVKLLYNAEDQSTWSGYCIHKTNSSFYSREFAALLENHFSD